jgi:hypothetical protein
MDNVNNKYKDIEFHDDDFVHKIIGFAPHQSYAEYLLLKRRYKKIEDLEFCDKTKRIKLYFYKRFFEQEQIEYNEIKFEFSEL